MIYNQQINLFNIKKKILIFIFSEVDSFDRHFLLIPSPPKKHRKVKVVSSKRRISQTKGFAFYSSYTCDTCNKKYKSKGTLRRHVQNECGKTGPFDCKECGKEYSRFDSLWRHKKYQCNPNNTRFICDYCGYKARRKSHMINHIETRHTVAKTTKTKNVFDYSISDGIFKCENCQKIYSRIDTLRRHVIKECSEGKKFTCKLCDMSFKRKAHLNQHMTARHQVKKIISCKKCGKKFTTDRGFNYHVKLVNCQKSDLEGEKLLEPKQEHEHSIEPAALHKCNTCNNTFATKRSFLFHAKIHCKKSVVFSCKYCEYSTNSKSELDNHFKLHHGSTLCLVNIKDSLTKEQPSLESHKCSRCERSFLTQKGLKIHLHSCGQLTSLASKDENVSVEKKPHEDTMKHDDLKVEKNEVKLEELTTKTDDIAPCKEISPSKKDNKLPTKEKNLESSSPSRNQNDPPIKPKTEKIYDCKQCDKKFEKKRILKYHVKYLCEKIPSLFCKHCSYSCKMKKHLDAHLINEHQVNIQHEDTIVSQRENSQKNTNIPTRQGNPKSLSVKKLKRIKCIRMITEKKVVQEENISRFNCKECEFSCKSKSILHNHVALKHNIRNVYDEETQN